MKSTRWQVPLRSSQARKAFKRKERSLTPPAAEGGEKGQGSRYLKADVLVPLKRTRRNYLEREAQERKKFPSYLNITPKIFWSILPQIQTWGVSGIT